MKKIFSILWMLILIGICGQTMAAEKYTTTLTTSTNVTVSLEYELDADGNIVNLKCTNKNGVSGELTIPSTIDGKKVVSLDSEAFSNCDNLVKIVLSENLTGIGKNAFYSCDGLASVTLPDSLLNIGDSAFKSCGALPNITIPNSVVSVGAYAFEYCRSLADVTLSDNLSAIQAGTFSWTAIKKIEIPSKVVTIAGSAFNCTKNMKILIPDSVISIADSAFLNATGDIIYGSTNSYAYRYVTERLYSQADTNTYKLTFVDSKYWNTNEVEEENISVSAISLPSTATVQLGKTITLTPTITPANATNKIVTWSSSDESVATVSNAGVVTAKKVGSAIITVVSQDGNKKATCTVTVTEVTNESTNNLNNNNTNTNNLTNQSSTNTSNSKTNSTTNTTNSLKVTSTNTANLTDSDTTTSQKVLPNTGKGFKILILSVFCISLVVIFRMKLKELKDVE